MYLHLRAHFRRWYALITHFMQLCENHLFVTADAASLAVFRISFGLLMMVDIPQERGFSVIDFKWGKPERCTFPLFNSMPKLPFEWLCVLYLTMWLGAFGIALGYRFRTSCLLFAIPYWYVLLLEKSNWNNHSYLFGLIAVLLFTTNANVLWSIDNLATTREGCNTSTHTVPAWNYFILRFQLFILYFMAGVKKINYDWLSGYSVMNLSRHWVFDPFRILLKDEQIDLWIIHRFGFFLDLTSGFGLYHAKARPITLIFLFFFHFMNSRMFTIGMFPYVGIATMFIFCDDNWPRKLPRRLSYLFGLLSRSKTKTRTTKIVSSTERAIKLQVHTLYKFKILTLIILHVVAQLFLPFSHFITKGYNGWTNGQYGYSWDMMVHSWDTMITVTTIKNKNTGEKFYLDTELWTMDDKWTRHPDMVKQFSTCIKNKFQSKHNLRNISIHLDVWSSLNKRFYQRMYNPRVDLLEAEWSPFKETSWVMPLLHELSGWRPMVLHIERNILNSAPHRDVVFFADFPGFYMDTFVDAELENVTLTVLQGKVQISSEHNSSFHTVNVGQTVPIPTNVFLRIHSIWSKPSCYYYSYFNRTMLNIGTSEEGNKETSILSRNLVTNYFMNVAHSLQFAFSSLFLIVQKYTFIGCCETHI